MKDYDFPENQLTDSHSLLRSVSEFLFLFFTFIFWCPWRSV